MNVSRIKQCLLSFSLGLSRFVRSARLAYLKSMSIQGTWADGIIIQAVADNLNLKIHITESLPNFAEFTVVKQLLLDNNLEQLINFLMCQLNIFVH